MHFVNTYRQERRKQHNQEFSWKKRISRQCTIKPGNTGETMQPRDKIEREREKLCACFTLICIAFCGCMLCLQFAFYAAFALAFCVKKQKRELCEELPQNV